MSDNNVKVKTSDNNKKGLFGFLKDIEGEIKKITWPSANETRKALVAVLIFTILYTILVGGLDFIFKGLFEMILKLK